MNDQTKRPAIARQRNEAITVEEASSQHSGRWILMEVTSFDDDKVPARGYVRIASKGRRKINDESLRLRAKSLAEKDSKHFYIFYAAAGASLLDPFLGIVDTA